MPFFHYLRSNNIQRFLIAIKEEGWRTAFRKARVYINMHRLGRSASSVPHKPDSPSAPHKPDLPNNGPYLGSFWLETARNGSFHIMCAPSVSMKRRKIVMIGDLNLPQCRKYRVEQPAELWAQDNVEYVYAHYQDIPRCINAMQDATHLMLYRLQSHSLVSMFMYEARRLRMPVLYDLDDPLFSISAYETYGNMKALPLEMKNHFLNEAPKYLDVMNGADLISVSTPGMKSHTELYNARPVFVRRNFADCETLETGALAIRAKKQRSRSDVFFRVAFASGSRGHEVDFAVIQEDIVKFLAKDHNRKLMILGYFDIQCLPSELREQVETFGFTTYGQYLENLAKADCAIMPLANDIFNSCKSAVRVLDANAVAVPTIVGTVSDMGFIVEDQKTGLVIPDQTSWQDALESMVNNRKETIKMGERARRALESDWSAKLKQPIIDSEIINWVKQ